MAKNEHMKGKVSICLMCAHQINGQCLYPQAPTAILALSKKGITCTKFEIPEIQQHESAFEKFLNKSEKIKWMWSGIDLEAIESNYPDELWYEATRLTNQSDPTEIEAFKDAISNELDIPSQELTRLITAESSLLIKKIQDKHVIPFNVGILAFDKNGSVMNAEHRNNPTVSEIKTLIENTRANCIRITINDKNELTFQTEKPHKFKTFRHLVHHNLAIKLSFIIEN